MAHWSLHRDVDQMPGGFCVSRCRATSGPKHEPVRLALDHLDRLQGGIRTTLFRVNPRPGFNSGSVAFGCRFARVLRSLECGQNDGCSNIGGRVGN